MSVRTILTFVLPLIIGCSGSAPIDGQLPARVDRAVDLGRMAPDAQIDFVVGLALRQPSALQRYVASRAVGDEPLQPSDFADGFAPTAQEYWRVVSWLRAHGALVTRTATGRTTVTAHATAAVVESLFAVELHQYADDEGEFFAASGPIAVANELVGTVNGVVGISGSGGWKPHLAWPNLGAGAALAPADMEKLYGSAAIANPGMGETVAILGAGNPPDPTVDLAAFMTSYHPYGITSPPPAYSQFLVGGPTRESASSANGEYIENVLDAEMVLSMAPFANIVHVITATNSPGLFTDGIVHIVNNVSQAHAVTVSFGGCERGAAQEVAVMNTLFEQAQAEGQQWFFASGDTGTDGCRDGAGNVHIAAGWPTSSPYIVGVGGTMIGTGGVEITWNQNSASGGEAAGGGGPSEIFKKPAYQLMGRTPSDNARDTPDVSAIASGVFIAVKGRTGTVGGTSAASPIVAGAWALVDQGKGGKGISDALTKIYMIGTTGAFNDVVMGNNGGPDGLSPGYPAGTAYDLATGWGSPNVAQLIAHMP
jgi:subtilase family serine protease